MTSSPITGGCGFLGRHLTRLLLDAGSEVTLLDPAPYSGELPSGARHLGGSVTDEAVLRDAMEGVGRVFHMAGTPHLWTPRGSGAYALHPDGTRAVLNEAARRGGVRVIYTSTEAILRDFTGSGGGRAAAVADNSGGEPWLPEACTLPPGYCRAKLAAERLVVSAAREGHDVVTVSPASLVGPGDTNLTPPTRMLIGFLQGRFPAFLEGWIRIADVRDVAIAHLDAAIRGEAGRRYVVGGHDQRMSAFLRTLEEVSGRPMPKRRVPAVLALAAAHLAEIVAGTLTRRAPNATVAGVRLALAPSTPEPGEAPRHGREGTRGGTREGTPGGTQETEGTREAGRVRDRAGFAPRELRVTLRDTIAWLERKGFLKSSRGRGDRAAR